MRVETIERKLFTFDELSDEAKETAIERYRENNLDYEWYDAVYDDAITIGKLIGIKIDRIYFSGFWSQGDGACFEGEYFYSAGSVKEIKAYAPIDTELHRIAKELQDIQKPAFYHLYAYVKHRGHYYHENCTEIDVRNDAQKFTDDQEQRLKDCLRDFMRWIYRQLEKEYEYLTSEEAIKETIEANEYEFTENGKLI